MNRFYKPKYAIMHKFIIIGASFLSIFISSCKKIVTVDPPTTKLVSGNVFTSTSAATAAQTSIYTSMFTDANTVNIEVYTGWSSDELFEYRGIPNHLYTNSLTAADDANDIGSVWSIPYNYIFQANSVIEGLTDFSGVGSAAKRQLIGEAKFIRAFWNFYLVNLYGDIQLVLTTDYKMNATGARVPKEKVYQQIVLDLQDASSTLSENFVDATDSVKTTERVRPTKWAAMALLARVYLYLGDYSNAEKMATSVISKSSMFSLCPDLNNVFVKNSTEAIWQLMPPPDVYATGDATVFQLLEQPGNSPLACSLSEFLVNAFEQDDNRRTQWIDSLVVYNSDVDSIVFYYPYKYQAGQLASEVREYGMVLRLAEQFLIRAEAKVQQNNLSEGADDLNEIRNRAGLQPTTASTKEELLTAISHERQVELFTEWGDRWFNLKRSGAIDSVMNVVSAQKGGSWNAKQGFYPIPLTDIQNNPNLKQTSGY